MNLEQLIGGLSEIPEDECIFARKPWSPNSEAITTRLEEDFKVPRNLTAVGLEYFLEVHVAKEVLKVFGDRPASKEDQLHLLIFYADNDTYPDWVYRR